jgi:protein-disulfide isomerase
MQEAILRRYVLPLVGLLVVAAAIAFYVLNGDGKRPTAEVIETPATAMPPPAAAPAATPAPQQPPAAPQVQVAQAPSAAPVTPAPQPGAPPTVAAMLQDRVLGKQDAPITIIEYASLTCPHCANFHTTVLPELKKRYVDTGKVKLIFRDFPFDAVALRAAMLARCAPAERYFGMLDVLFRGQDTWSRAQDPLQSLSQTARLAGINQQEFDACMANQDLLNGIVNIRLQGEQGFQVNSTPTFVIQRGDRQEKVTGAQPVESFAQILDRLGS